MFGIFGAFGFASLWYIPTAKPKGKNVALLGDSSNHGGVITTSNQDGTLTVGGVEVAVSGALHSCPITGHGVTSITPITVKTYQNGKLILTEGAMSACGAILIPPDRNVYIE
jgi:uncharacterized Zn-binding protein involved in type VI secretion